VEARKGTLGRTGAVVCALAALVLVQAPATLAGGGHSISTAPQIPLGQQQVNSLNGIDFWRLSLRAGDVLTLRFGPQQRYKWVEVCVFQPGVSDTTVGNQPCYAHKTVDGDDDMELSAREPGLWAVALLPYPGDCESGGILNLRCNSFVSYHLTAYVKHRTQLTLSVPNLVHLGSVFALRGRLSGGARGAVLIEGSWDGAAWRTVGFARIRIGGAFKLTVRASRRGTLRLRATFPEAPNYAASTALGAVRIA